MRAAIRGLFARHGACDYICEAVTQEQHMLQAAEWVRKQGHGPDVQLAALLHDIGHLVALDDGLDTMVHKGVSYGGKDHEVVGANFLRKLGIKEDVCRMVEHHVDAKRFLVGCDASYAARLSEASTVTLRLQGGAMTSKECLAFHINPLSDAFLVLREAEEQAKTIGTNTDTLDQWLDRLGVDNNNK